MSPLNDDELNSLLEQAKKKQVEPRPAAGIRALRAYQANVLRPPKGRGLLLHPVSIPLPLGVLAAILLVLIGAVGGSTFRRPSVVVQTRSVEVPVTREHIVYRDCSAAPQESSPRIAILTFKEFQPVRQIRPRVVRSIRDDE